MEVFSDRPAPAVPRSFIGKLTYDQLLEATDRRVRNFSEVLQAENKRLGRDPLQPLDPTEASVRYRKAAATLFEPFGHASEKMQELLPVPRRAELLEAFGGECERIAHTRAAATRVLEAQGFQSAYDEGVDDRLRRCLRACDSVEAVLADCGLQERLRQAKEKWAHKVQDDFVQEAGPDLPPPAPRVGPDLEALRWSYLQRIDALRPDENVSHLMDELFDLYGSGHEVLEGRDVAGSSYSLAVGDMMRYVQHEWGEREERLKSKLKKESVLGPLAEDRAREWVLKAIDPSGEGCITKDEAYAGFKIVVDEVDPPSERRPSKRTDEADAPSQSDS